MPNKLDEFRRNQQKLEQCDGHYFRPKGHLGRPFARFICEHCMGEVDATCYYWFCKGVETARRNPLPRAGEEMNGA